LIGTEVGDLTEERKEKGYTSRIGSIITEEEKEEVLKTERLI